MLDIRKEDRGNGVEKQGVRPQIYPISAERELARLNLTYINAMRKSFKIYLPELLDLYEINTRSDSRFDDLSGFRDKVASVFNKISSDFEKSTSRFQIHKLVHKAAEVAKRASVRDWIDIVKRSLGLTVYKEYYDDLLSEKINRWVANNVSYVSTLPKAQLNVLQDIIIWGYQTKQPKINVYNRIQKQLGTSKSYARMLARDQLGTLNSQIMQEEQKSMGCTKYKWKTKHDSRVRESHAELDGKIFSWDNPPEMWIITKSGRRSSGRFCHPGEDYQCRCVAVPVFDVEEAGKMAARHRYRSM